jgi:hypothetical protein
VGESIGSTFTRYGVPLVYPSNNRLNGWQRLHEALAPCHGHDHAPKPWLTMHPRCRYGVRTLPLMAQAKDNPEDIDTDSDDHFCDALRYLLMGGVRPASGRQVEPPAPYLSLKWFRQQFPDEPRGVLA